MTSLISVCTAGAGNLDYFNESGSGTGDAATRVGMSAYRSTITYKRQTTWFELRPG